MSSFSRFQDINQKRGIANQETNASFIIKGYPSISIKNAQTGEEQPASVVNRQEKDLAYIYTHINQPIEVGSVWGAKELKWLISEEIVIIKNVAWHKYVAFLCNVEVDGFWGYFKSPEKTYINVVLQEKELLQSQQKPILVLGQDIFSIGDKFKIKDRAWMIQEKDNFDQNGVVYYSLTPTTISKDVTNTDLSVKSKESVEVTPKIKSPSEYGFIPNKSITLPTRDFYFKSSVNGVQIISLLENEVTFKIPFGIDKVLIYTKDPYLYDTIYETEFRKEL